MEIEKLSPIQRIQKGINTIPGIIAERYSKDRKANVLYHRIGEGEIRIDNASPEEALDIGLRIGQIKSKIKTHVAMLDERLPALKADIEAYNKATSYLSELSIKREKINKLSEMYAEGDLTGDQYRSLMQNFREFSDLQTVDPVISRGIELVNKEEEWRREQEEARSDNPPAATTVFEVKSKKKPVKKPQGQKRVTPKVPDEKAKRDQEEKKDEGFVLPNGEIITGLSGRLIEILNEAEEESEATRSMLIERLYPGIDKVDAFKKFSMLITDARKKLRKHGYSLENKKQVGLKSNKKEGYYKITRLDGTVGNGSESRKPQTPELLIASVGEESEYGLWSANDVAIIATAVLGQYDRLEQIFNASNILPLERTKVDNLSKMGVNDPNLEPGAMSEKNRVHLLRTKRSNALNKVINMIYDPEFEDKMHALHKEHIGVWELLMKITEMKGIKAEYGIENVDVRFEELEGIEILRKLFTDPAVEKKTFRILNVRENIDIATIIANREALVGRVHDEAVVYDSNHTKTTEQGKKKKVKQQPKQRNQEKPKKEKKNGISKLEKKDPKIRERIFYTFDIITANHSFVKPIGPKRVLSEFPEISEESLNSFLGQLEARYNANNIPMKPRLGIREIAALYYENMYGVNLTSQQKKKLRQLVDELCSEWFEEK